MTASDGEEGDGFGFTTTVSGNVLAVGAPIKSTDKGEFAGSVYVYSRNIESNVWQHEKRLEASDGVQGSLFGHSVALGEEQLFVGTYSSGPVYAFSRLHDDWTEVQRLPSPTGLEDGFGAALAVDDQTMLVGAFLDDNGVGAAYVYSYEGGKWGNQATLKASNGERYDYFGMAVALSGDTALVGAPGRDASGIPEAGTAYVFTRSASTWTEQQQLVAPTPATGASAGMSLVMTDDTIFIGAPHDELSAGAAYVWTRDGNWKHRAKLTGATGGEQFGHSLALWGRTVLVGALSYDEARGAAYLFAGGGADWHFDRELTASGATRNAEFGRSVALDGTSLLVAAPLAQAGKGAAYVESHNNGVSCADGANCDSAFCREGVCCDSACDQPCQTCLGAKKPSGPDGVCGPSKGLAGDRCELVPPDADGCSRGECAPFLCQRGTCTTACSSDQDCARAHAFCDAEGACRLKLAPGARCTEALECLSDCCMDGLCCDDCCSADDRSYASAGAGGYGPSEDNAKHAQAGEQDAGNVPSVAPAPVIDSADQSAGCGCRVPAKQSISGSAILGFGALAFRRRRAPSAKAVARAKLLSRNRLAKRSRETFDQKS